MTKVSLLITEELDGFSLIESKINALDASQVLLDVVVISHKEDSYEWSFNKENISLQKVIYPQEEDLLLRDVLSILKGEYMIPFSGETAYPSDFLQQLFPEEETQDKGNNMERGSYIPRLLKAMQQSKYGLGVVKEDIKRIYPELADSVAYKCSDFTKLAQLEMEIDATFASRLKHHQSAMKPQSYAPNYKKIKYYNSISNYKKGIKEQAPLLSYKNKPNAIGLPLYMILFILVSFVASFIFPQALFFLMVMGALYLLALTLECLAVSTLKKQGDLFLGLMFGFVVLHFNYLWFYFLGRSRSA